MRLLELFSGTQSVGKIAKKLGYEVVSLDICDYNGKFSPTHKTNILEFNYKQYDRNYFTTIWASPPCTYYSVLQRCWYGIKKKEGLFTKDIHEKQMLLSDTWVKKVFEIIEYFNVKKWFIENPRTGLLRKRRFMEYIPYIDVDYCRYSDWGYRKQTRIWCNLLNFNGKVCNKKCGNLKKAGDLTNKRSPFKVGGTTHRVDATKDLGKLDRYRIPPILIKELFTHSDI